MRKSEPAPASADDPRSITAYHAHVYYDPAKTRDRAERLRERVGKRFPHAKLGRWHDALVGPHPQAMYHIAFAPDMLADFVPWLMLNREGLDVLIHPLTESSYDDHSKNAMWLGTPVPMKLDILRPKYSEHLLPTSQRAPAA
jgi:aromatic ring-cleaving dioxygenase